MESSRVTAARCHLQARPCSRRSSANPGHRFYSAGGAGLRQMPAQVTHSIRVSHDIHGFPVPPYSSVHLVLFSIHTVASPPTLAYYPAALHWVSPPAAMLHSQHPNGKSLPLVLQPPISPPSTGAEPKDEAEVTVRPFAGMLSRPVTPNTTRREYALLELLRSERTYVSDLTLLRDYQIPLALGESFPVYQAC